MKSHCRQLQQLPYHDFIIGQGLLPFDLLEKAVMEEFVPSQRKGAE